MELKLRRHKDDNEMIEMLGEYGSGKPMLLGVVHGDAFFDTGDNTIYEMLKEYDELNIELKVKGY